MEIQTHKKDFSMQMWKPYRKKEKHAVQDSSCAQRKQYSMKCLHRWPDNLLPFNYAASSTSTWQILKDMTSSSKLNPSSPLNCGQSGFTNKTLNSCSYKENQYHWILLLEWIKKQIKSLFKALFQWNIMQIVLVSEISGRPCVIIFNHRVGHCLD